MDLYLLNLNMKARRQIKGKRGYAREAKSIQKKHLDKAKYAGWYCEEKRCGTVIYMASENDITKHLKLHK